MTTIRRLQSFALGAALFAAAPAAAQQQAIYSATDIHHPVFARSGMVASQEALATRIGVAILRDGGNAVDAAVAVGFALAVTLPRAGNLGGGGFMLVHDQKTCKTVAIDYREKAPAAAKRDMYLDDKGEVIKDKSRFSPHAVGVPGTVAGLALAHERYGRLPFHRLVQPAIRLARDGIIVTPGLAASLIRGQKRLSKHPASRAVFFKRDGSAYEAGERLTRPDLARTLAAIAERGGEAFYEGATAQKIAAYMAEIGGAITLDDLKAYRAIVREPVRGSYRGFEIRSMPPPSSGGVHLVQLLNILEGVPLKELGHNSAAAIHMMVEAMKLAYADRAEHLGDPDFWQVPLKGLTSKKYAASLRDLIDAKRARPAQEIRAGKPAAYESNETTHYSIVDKDGNAVSNTYTLNFSFGSGLMAPGTGVLLNNEMDDFSAKPGVPNAYGLLGGEANAVAAGKRPLSSMTPTIVLQDGQAYLVTGSPGGSRIITTVLQIILNVIDHQMNIAAASAAPRIHHQWLPDHIRVEPGLSVDTMTLLRARGHSFKQRWSMGSTQSIMRLEGGLLGASDPRRLGALTLGY